MKAATRWFLSLVAASLVVSCRPEPPADPNAADVRTNAIGADTMLKSLSWMSDQVNERQAKGLITEEEGKTALTRYAARLVGRIDRAQVKPGDAWKVATVLLTAKKWKEAETMLVTAVSHAVAVKDEDRRVNDTLRLARAKAELGKVKEAIATAKKAFDASDINSAPLLPATLLEIVPAAQGKGADADLAKLLEMAISAHRRTKVDPESAAGRAFLSAKWFHIENGWKRAIQLYQEAGREDLARAAALRAEKMLVNFRRA